MFSRNIKNPQVVFEVSLLSAAVVVTVFIRENNMELDNDRQDIQTIKK